MSMIDAVVSNNCRESGCRIQARRKTNARLIECGLDFHRVRKIAQNRDRERRVANLKLYCCNEANSRSRHLVTKHMI